MAKKKNVENNTPNVPTLLLMSRQKFEETLKKQIKAGKLLQATQVAIYDSPNPFRKEERDRIVDETAYEMFHSEYGKWDGFNLELLKRSFTNQGGEYLQKYADCGQILLYSDINKVDFLKKLIKEKIDELQTLVTQLPLIPLSEDVKDDSAKVEEKNMKQVFIVYGHDKQMKLEVESFLEKDLHLDVIALDEKPNRNRTIIEKFEYYSKDAGYAVILMSPDDNMEVDGQIYKHARQNVVLELGYFMAKLGRPNVCVVLKDDVEKPSDISGVLHISFSGNWREELHRELKDAGIEC